MCNKYLLNEGNHRVVLDWFFNFGGQRKSLQSCSLHLLGYWLSRRDWDRRVGWASGHPWCGAPPCAVGTTPQPVCFPGPVVASAVHDTTPSAHSPRLPRLHKVERESFLPSKDEASFCTPVASYSILWGYAPVLPLPFINWLLLITFKHLKFLSLC